MAVCNPQGGAGDVENPLEGVQMVQVCRGESTQTWSRGTVMNHPAFTFGFSWCWSAESSNRMPSLATRAACTSAAAPLRFRFQMISSPILAWHKVLAED